jgi:hypothetical protein
MALIAGLSDTPLGQALRRSAGSVRLPRITPGRVLIFASLLAVVAGAALLWKGEGLALSAPLLPEGLAWMAVFDIAAYAEVIAVMAIVAATLRFRVLWAVIRSAIRRSVGVILSLRRRGSRRAARPHRPRSKTPSADEDEGWASIAADIALQRPLNAAGRFCRKAWTPSAKSSVLPAEVWVVASA